MLLAAISRFFTASSVSGDVFASVFSSFRLTDFPSAVRSDPSGPIEAVIPILCNTVTIFSANARPDRAPPPPLLSN